MEILFWLIGVIVAIFCLTVLRGAPYVPSRKRDIESMFDSLYQLKKTDLLVDIGSGDGVVLRQAAKRGARAVGLEVNPILVVISKIISGKNKRIETWWRDFWLTELPNDTTVIYMFSESRDIKRMIRRIQNEATRLKRQLFVISYAFDVPGIKPVNSNKSYFLYKIDPLQADQP